MNKKAYEKAVKSHPSEVIEPFDEIIELIGVEATITLIEHFQGQQIYVPTMKKAISGCLIKQAKEEFDGGNYRILCKKYGFSERHLRRLL